MTFDDYKRLLEGKHCPHCGAPVDKKQAGFTGDNYGWRIDDYFFPVTMYVNCHVCGRRMISFRQLGIRNMSGKTRYVM